MADNQSSCWTCDPVTNLTNDVNETWAQWLCGKPTCWPENIVVDFDNRQVTGITEAQRLQLNKCEPDDAGTYAPWIVALRDIILSWEIDRIRCESHRETLANESLGNVYNVGQESTGSPLAITGSTFTPAVPTQTVTLPLTSVPDWATHAEVTLTSELVADNITATNGMTRAFFTISINNRRYGLVRWDDGNVGPAESYDGIGRVLTLPLTGNSVTFDVEFDAGCTDTFTTTAEFWDATLVADVTKFIRFQDD